MMDHGSLAPQRSSAPPLPPKENPKKRTGFSAGFTAPSENFLPLGSRPRNIGTGVLVASFSKVHPVNVLR